MGIRVTVTGLLIIIPAMSAHEKLIKNWACVRAILLQIFQGDLQIEILFIPF